MLYEVLTDFLRMLQDVPAWQRGKYLERVRVAEEQKVALVPQVPRLTLLFPKDLPAGVRIFRDGTEVSWVSMGVPLPMDPSYNFV